jgi:hypothetical protein
MLRNLLILLCVPIFYSVANAQMKFPTPPDTKERLFYLQRVPNANTVIYDINFTAEGKIKKEDPVHAYWIKYEKGGVMEELLSIEQRLAYGVESKLIDVARNIFCINLVAYKKLDIILKPGGPKSDKKYQAYVSVNGKTIVLAKVFLNIEGGTLLKPNITYIEFSGKDDKTGKELVERIKP